MIIEAYDEQNDTFTVRNETTGDTFSIDAGALARMLNMYDEPDTFIGLSFSVSYRVNATAYVQA